MVHEYVRHQTLSSVWKKLFKIAGLHGFCLYKFKFKETGPEQLSRAIMERTLPCPPVLSNRDWEAVGITMNRNNGELCGDRLLLQSPCWRLLCRTCMYYTNIHMYGSLFPPRNETRKTVLTFLAILNLYQERKYKFKKIKQLWENVAGGKKERRWKQMLYLRLYISEFVTIVSYKLATAIKSSSLRYKLALQKSQLPLFFLLWFFIPYSMTS